MSKAPRHKHSTALLWLSLAETARRRSPESLLVKEGLRNCRGRAVPRGRFAFHQAPPATQLDQDPIITAAEDFHSGNRVRTKNGNGWCKRQASARPKYSALRIRFQVPSFACKETGILGGCWSWRPRWAVGHFRRSPLCYAMRAACVLACVLQVQC